MDKELVRFFKDLYKTGPHSADETYLNNLESPKLSEREKAWLDRVIDTNEIAASIRCMKPNKCPGTDGLPVEFFRTFWDEIKIILYSVYQTAISNKLFHLSTCRALISLVEKLGRDHLWVKNWRPLLFMNVDFQIFSKVLADRVQVVLGSIIHKDQLGFLKGRYFGENLMELLSMIEYCNKEEIDAIIINFDFEKAFNRIEWSILDQVLKFFNFGENFQD